MGSDGPRDGEPRDKREAILAAVTRVIARNGVRGLRVEQVAAEAGVSAPLLYYHFESREGLVGAALERAGARAPSASLREPFEGTAFEAVSEALLGELSDRAEVRDNAVVWGEISASAVFDEGLRADLRRVNDDWRDQVERAIRAGISDGSIQGAVAPDAAAELLVALVDGLCTRWLAGSISREQAVDLLREGLIQTLLRPSAG